MNKLSEIIGLIETADFFHLKTSPNIGEVITTKEELIQLYKLTRIYEQIRVSIFQEYQREYQKTLTRTTFSNWMRGITTPNPIQEKIISKALEKYNNGRIER